MKNFIYVLLSLFCLISLIGCSNSSTIVVDENGNTYDWGIVFTAENVTSTSLTIKCIQSGGNPTGELMTGSEFIIYQKIENVWKPVKTLFEADWTLEGWIIPMDDTISWDTSWQDLYGELPPGTYRIGKEVMDFRKAGDYDEAMHYAEFEIK